MDDGLTDDLSYELGTSGEKMQNFSENSSVVMDNATMDSATLCNFGGFQDSYGAAHGYLAIIVCVFGTFFNFLNIIVLGHKEMRGNPINLILFSIAVADILLMLEYIPFTVHMYILMQNVDRDREDKLSYGWGMVILFHVNFSLMIHTVSIWLTLSLAIWRYIMIKYHSLAQSLCTIRRCKIVLFLGYVVPAFLTVPNYLALSLTPSTELNKNGSNITVWKLQMSHVHPFLRKFNVLFYSFFLKLIPCIILTLVTALLVKAMVQAMKRAQRLKDMSNRSEKRALVNGNGNKAPVNRQKKTDRTTRLLITILLLFLATEFPQVHQGNPGLSNNGNKRLRAASVTAIPLKSPATAVRVAATAGGVCPAVSVMVPADKPTTVTNFCHTGGDYPDHCI